MYTYTVFEYCRKSYSLDLLVEGFCTTRRILYYSVVALHVSNAGTSRSTASYS